MATTQPVFKPWQVGASGWTACSWNRIWKPGLRASECPGTDRSKNMVEWQEATEQKAVWHLFWRTITSVWQGSDCALFFQGLDICCAIFPDQKVKEECSFWFHSTMLAISSPFRQPFGLGGKKIYQQLSTHSLFCYEAWAFCFQNCDADRVEGSHPDTVLHQGTPPHLLRASYCQSASCLHASSLVKVLAHSGKTLKSRDAQTLFSQMYIISLICAN